MKRKRRINLPQLPQDKANHFIYGAFAYALSSLVMDPFPAMYIVLSLAFFKEFADTYKDTADFSLMDFIVTALGGLFIMLIKTI